MVLVTPELVGADEIARRQAIARAQGGEVGRNPFGWRKAGEAYDMHLVVVLGVMKAEVGRHILAGDHHVAVGGEPAGVALQPRGELLGREVLGEAMFLEVGDPLDRAELQPRRRAHEQQVDLFPGIRLAEWPEPRTRRRHFDAGAREPRQPRIAGRRLQLFQRRLVATHYDQARLVGLGKQAEGLDEVADIIDPAGPGVLVGVAQADGQGPGHHPARAFSPRRKPSSLSPCRLQT